MHGSPLLFHLRSASQADVSRVVKRRQVNSAGFLLLLLNLNLLLCAGLQCLLCGWWS